MQLPGCSALQPRSWPPASVALSFSDLNRTMEIEHAVRRALHPRGAFSWSSEGVGPNSYQMP